jgi:hypothetical protein
MDSITRCVHSPPAAMLALVVTSRIACFSADICAGAQSWQESWRQRA